MTSDLTAHYDGSCEICRTSAARVHRWDRRGAVTIVPTDPSELGGELRVVRADGTSLRGWDGLVELGRVVPRLRPLRVIDRVPGGRALGRWMYRLLARNRYRWNRRDNDARRIT